MFLAHYMFVGKKSRQKGDSGEEVTGGSETMDISETEVQSGHANDEL